MREQNGIQIFDAREKPPLPNDLQSDFEVQSLFGFKVIKIQGRSMWAVASEEDYRNTVAQLLGITPQEVKIDVKGVGPCLNVTPTTCDGICWHPSPFCTLIYRPTDHHYVCLCMPP